MPATTLAPFLACTRLGFGASPRDIERIRAQGFSRWLDAQLAPPSGDDADTASRIASARLRIKYAANPGQEIAAVDEARPLHALDQSISETWQLLDGGQKVANQERVRPRYELVVATLLRGMHSPWQLRERMVEFWHDHFNVQGFDAQVAVALPTYDRDVIRKHALGNFRDLLGAVAQSTAMLVYLNNRSSRAGSANENYARELFELHTLGRGAYLNAQYDKWRAVPGALQGKPSGYIDQDVYEAARAFTGWTIEDGGTVANGRKLPKTGRFTYVDSFHDGYQKRILAREFDPFRPAMRDGEDVLDLVATHPATANFVAGKLVRRFIEDTPPPGLVARVADVFRRNANAHDQIARTMRAIATAPELTEAAGRKARRPAELVIALARGLDHELTVTDQFIGVLDGSGQRLFGWPAPTGHPDDAASWLGTQAMRQRWQLVLGVLENSWGTGEFDAPSLTPSGTHTNGEIVAAWQERLLGARDAGQAQAILTAMKLPDDAPPQNVQRLRRMVAYVAMSPGFQMR
ncbi:DUF1800 domain-containing protein [Roseiterribacter gracilis]|uniref:DUF1800 domain-containing protein n=1 Tax=Roseiterribacter gracilis TaxID=2812848 RepID=A0A8S8XIC4_9PROT|nr:hypothetical protein TMPK1_36040 [Rhodospirillales bacterium TMPK1]